MRMATTQPIPMATAIPPMPTAMGTQPIPTAMPTQPIRMAMAATMAVTGPIIVPHFMEAIGSPDGLRSTVLAGVDAAGATP
jgi:hypothetical protein